MIYSSGWNWISKAGRSVNPALDSLRAVSAASWDGTQSQLAKLVGASASVISRFENADYEGHSLAMRRRVAKALNSRVEIRFVPIEEASASTS